ARPSRCAVVRLLGMAAIAGVMAGAGPGCRGAEAPTGPMAVPGPAMRGDAAVTAANDAGGDAGAAAAAEAADAGVEDAAALASCPCGPGDGAQIEGTSAPHDV